MIFSDSVTYMLSDRNYRKRPMNIDLLSEVNYNTLEKIYRNRFADASDFTFVFVGNINPEEFKPLVETYLGSLPSVDRTETWKDNNIRFPKGETKNPFSISMQVPKSSCLVAYQSKAVYNFNNKVYMDAIDHVLGLRYTETIREEEGGTYGVSARGNLSKTPFEQASVIMFFDTDPEKADHLVGIIHSELKKIVDEGPTEVDLNKAREYFLKTRQERLRENRFWSSAIREYYSNDVDLINGYEDFVKNLNVIDVQKAAQDFFKDANTLEVIMSPKN
jgi:zinc protease